MQYSKTTVSITLIIGGVLCFIAGMGVASLLQSNQSDSAVSQSDKILPKETRSDYSQIDSLECRQQTCHLFVKETQAGIYTAMQADLQAQDWYAYLQVESNSHISMWYDDNPGQQNNRLYYQLIAKRQ